MDKINENITRIFLYISIILLVIGVIATAMLPIDAPEKVVGYITIGINLVSIVCISGYIHNKYKKEEKSNERQLQNKVLDFIQKREK